MYEKVLKIAALIVLTVIIVAITGVIGYVKQPCLLLMFPDASDLKINYTAERIERGKYLANNVAMCIDCHSARLYRFRGPLIPGTEGKGGEKVQQRTGFREISMQPTLRLRPLATGLTVSCFAPLQPVFQRRYALFPVMLISTSARWTKKIFTPSSLTSAH